MLGVVLGLAFVIARHDEYALLKSVQESADNSNPAIAAKPDANHAQKNAEDSWNSPSGHIFHDAFRWPEGTTVWAIILTLAAIAEQANEAAKATKVMRRSIEVQEAEFAQWLDIGKWVVEYDRSEYQLARSGSQIFNHPGKMKVRISFPLLNNTARPLFIKSVRTLLAIGTEKVFKAFLTEESITVPPKDEYRVVINTTLDKEQVTGYIAYTLPIEASVQVNFSNALHIPDYAGFRRLVMCNAFDGITTVSKGHVSKGYR